MAFAGPSARALFVLPQCPGAAAIQCSALGHVVGSGGLTISDGFKGLYELFLEVYAGNMMADVDEQVELSKLLAGFPVKSWYP